MAQEFEPIKANSNGHLLYIWTTDEADEEVWACCAYDHGPMCRLCQQLPDDDGITMSLLSAVSDGDMEVSADADGSFRFKLTDQGNAKARRLISEPGEAQEFYDRLVTSEMEKMGDG